MDTIDLYKQYGLIKPDKAGGKLHIYQVDKSLPIALIMPGGSYAFVSEGEWLSVVEAFMSRGYNAAVLEYSVAPVRHPAQIVEACMAMDYLHTILTDVYVVGFSAAGHLSLMLSSLYGDYPQYKARPIATCAVYPVVSSAFRLKHRQSFHNLCGANRVLQAELSADKLVGCNTCPICLFHAKDDVGVKYRNSIVMADALEKFQIPHELTLYSKGGHGFSVGNSKYPETFGWIDGCIKFFSANSR